MVDSGYWAFGVPSEMGTRTVRMNSLASLALASLGMLMDEVLSSNSATSGVR